MLCLKPPTYSLHVEVGPLIDDAFIAKGHAAPPSWYKASRGGGASTVTKERSTSLTRAEKYELELFSEFWTNFQMI